MRNTRGRYWSMAWPSLMNSWLTGWWTTLQSDTEYYSAPRRRDCRLQIGRVLKGSQGAWKRKESEVRARLPLELARFRPAGEGYWTGLAISNDASNLLLLLSPPLSRELNSRDSPGSRFFTLAVRCCGVGSLTWAWAFGRVRRFRCRIFDSSVCSGWMDGWPHHHDRQQPLTVTRYLLSMVFLCDGPRYSHHLAAKGTEEKGGKWEKGEWANGRMHGTARQKQASRQALSTWS